jgi:hypothetical protein
MSVGHYGYLACPPPPRQVVAALYDRIEGIRFNGRGRSAGRELDAVVGAWDEEHEERLQNPRQGIDDLLRGD